MRQLKIGYFADGIWAHNAFKKIISDSRFSVKFIVPRYDSSDSVLF
ncbi:TPA: methionyl-tRNA formyltransferase, partial [Campylobacter lari]|nr:methionyl-tRNA formyltransferase [Campylobacter lari]